MYQSMSKQLVFKMDFEALLIFCVGYLQTSPDTDRASNMHEAIHCHQSGHGNVERNGIVQWNPPEMFARGRVGRPVAWDETVLAT